MGRLVQVRNATVDDAEAISLLLTSSADTFFADDFTPEGLSRFKADFSRNRVCERLLSEEYRYYVADMDGTIIGVCALRGDSHLYNLFTSPHFHRQGVATSLWERVVSELTGDGVIEVTVNASNYAVPAYERFGFIRVGPTKEVDGIVFNPMINQIGG